ncbi:MAG: RNA polymerase sigma factor [Acidimicrobiales bacterium]
MTGPAASAATDRAERHRRVFARHVEPEVELLLRVARTLVSRDADAEDLVQETLLRAFRSMETFDGRFARAWLLTIMRNANINLHRRRRPELLANPETELELLAGSEPPHHSPEHRAEVVAFDEGVSRALNALSANHREVLVLVDVAGLSYAEAARTLEVPLGTIMSRLHRGRSRIRGHMEALGLAPGDGHG